VEKRFGGHMALDNQAQPFVPVTIQSNVFIVFKLKLNNYKLK